MKKLIYLFLILSLSGCVSNKDFNKACSYEKKTTHLEDKTSINITYDSEDLVREAVIIQNYKALDDIGKENLANIKEASSYYNNKYSDKEILLYVSRDTLEEYEIKYKLDVQKLDDDILNEFKLKKNSIKFFNKMKEENIECEGN